MLGVFFIKAAAYKIVEENSKHGKESYFYSIEHKSQKSFGHASALQSGYPHEDFDPGKSKYQNLFLLVNWSTLVIFAIKSHYNFTKI